MIYNQWYPVVESKEVKKNKVLYIKRLNRDLVFWRDNNKEIHCVDKLCRHRQASLGLGKVVNNNIECPFHGIQYDGDGCCKLIPANGKNAKLPDNYYIESFKVRDEFGFIWLWLGDKDEIHKDLPFFKDIDSSFTYTSIKEVWDTHYSRAIENQLDVVHLPFVHRTTIGKGNKTVVNGPYIKIDNDNNGMKIWVYNEVDKGQIGLMQKDLEEPKGSYRLRFRFPNIWENRLSDKSRLIAYFVPIDDVSIMMYVRFYQKLLKVPILKNILNFTFANFSKIILHQDKRVVITQEPKKSEYKMRERLISEDSPIIYYRKRRYELQKQNPFPEKTKN